MARLNHATKNETMKIMITPYLAATVNYATMIKQLRLLTLYTIAMIQNFGGRKY